ncbi:DNA-3-methyladenine glycosylase 2 family protein [Candidatus Microgenomates bacterium]|nr:DNA-3-methyladenine glycosylase 2 family protein [Candidatus Microgenomates bacterium]
MSNYKGVIIEESLCNKSVLHELKILKTKVEKVTKEHQTPYLKQWTLSTVEVAEKDANDVAKKISKSFDKVHNDWYADYKNDKYHYIIYPNKIFKVDFKNPEEYQPATDYGISIGIPPYQLDFSPTISIPIPRESQPYNFDYFLTHYVFYPWVVEDKKLVRLFKLPSGKFVLTRTGFIEKQHPTLTVALESKQTLTDEDRKWVIDMISWIFSVKDEVKEFYEIICQKDSILKAASREIYGAHLRTDPYVFESVLGVIMAQNVFFQRIYEMNRLLSQKFGEKQKFGKTTYYTFPTPEKLAKAELSEIRACKVGYRDKYIKGVAQKVVNEKLNLDELRKLTDINLIREKLIELPGVGPYTADLAIAIGFRLPTFHLDLFSREAMYQFYFKGKTVTDRELREFVDKRWGRWKAFVMLLLTTNTDTWAKETGKEFRLKSAAKSPS